MKTLTALVLAVTSMGLTGCATGARAYADTAIGNRSEAATVWNRPQEVGFDWGSDIEAEVSRQCVFGIICWGYEDGSPLDALTGIIGSIFGGGGGKEVADPLVRAAAAVAVANAQKADGIFVVSHDTDSFDIFIFRRRTARVKGKAFTLRPMGEVAQDRADRVRNLSALGGRALVSVPDITR
jgi:outer membrane lipoprotein SlyB